MSSVAIKVIRLPLFFVYYLKAVLESNLVVIRSSLPGGPPPEPVFCEVSVRGLLPLETWLLGTLITMTPGTLTVDLRTDHEILVVHLFHKGEELGFREVFLPRFFWACGVPMP